jgi:hypothetical protein
MPGDVYYVDSVERTLEGKLGERFSVLDVSTTAGKGTLDEAPVFLKAYDSKITKGGGSIHVPGAVGAGYRLDQPLNLNGTVAIEFVGDGRASKIFRGANMPAGKGVLDFTGAKHLTFRKLLFDGNVTTSTKLDYSAFGNDPAHPSLSTNSMFWLRGAEDITFIDCDFEHTGGYSHYLDARNALVKGVRFINCRWTNNRPHMLGTAGDLDYGSPTGGILYQNQGTGSSRVEDLTVRGCKFARSTGRGVFGHGYSFDTPHQRIHVDNNSFVDMGLNGIVFGNTSGGSAIGNSFRRIGYITMDDTGASAPKWHPGNRPSGIRTFGVVKLLPISSNDFVSVNGAAIEGDGYCYGVISGNTIRVPHSGEPEYAEDTIGSAGPGGAGNWMQGVVTSNTANREGGQAVTISGNSFDNVGGWNIGLYAARKCQAIGNLLIVPSAPKQVPIIIGGQGAGANQMATENLVTENTIHYAPATSSPAVFEDPTDRAFVPTDRNNVIKNYIVGANAFEFRRDPNSVSSAALFFTTSSVATSQSRHGLQREGIGKDSALRFYAQDGDPFGWLHMQLQMYRDAGARGPLLNVSETGPGPPEMINEGGVITTGPYTTAVFGNAMITGKLMGTGFLALSESSYWDVEANMLLDDWALLRWDNINNKWQQSISTADGARVWSDFGAGGTAGIPGGLNTHVQFNDNGAFGGVQEFTYDKGSKQLTLHSYAYNGITMPNGGFLGENVNVKKYAAFSFVNEVLTPAGADTFNEKLMLFAEGPGGTLRLVRGLGDDSYVDWDLQCRGIWVSGMSPNKDDILAEDGSVRARYLTTRESLIFKQQPASPLPELSASGETRLAANVDGQMYISTDGQNWGPFGLGTPAGGHRQIQYNNNGAFGADASLMYLPGQILDVGGGVRMDNLWFYQYPGTEAPIVSARGQVKIYANTDGLMYISTDGQPYGPFSLTPAGSDGEVQFNNKGAFGASEFFYWDNRPDHLTLSITCVAGHPAISVSGGWVQSEGGFLTFNTEPTAIQAPEGGVRAAIVNASKYISVTQTPNLVPLENDSLIGKAALWFNSANNYAYMSTWVGQGWAYCGMVVGELVAAQHVTTYNGLVFIQQDPAPPVSGANSVRIYANKNGLMYISTNTAPYGPWGGSGLPAGANEQVQYNKGGVFGADPGFRWATGAQTVFLTNTVGNYSLRMSRPLTDGAVRSGHEYGFAVISDGTFIVDDLTFGQRMLTWVPDNQPPNAQGGYTNAWTQNFALQGTMQCFYVNAVGGYPGSGVAPVVNTIQAAYGGVSARWLTATESLIFSMRAQPAKSGPNEIRLYADSNGQMYISTNQAAWGPLSGIGGGSTPGGAHLQVQYNLAGAFGASADLVFDPGASKTLNIGGGSSDTASRLMTNSTGMARNPSTGQFIPPNNAAGDIHWRLHRPWIRFWDIGIASSGQFVIRDGSYNDMVDLSITFTSEATGASVVVFTPGYFQSNAGFLTTGTAYSSVDARNGGALVQTLSFARMATEPSRSNAAGTAGAAPYGDVKLYANTNGQMYISTNGAAYGPFGGGGGGGTPGGAATQVQFNKAGTFGGDGDFTFSPETSAGANNANLNLWGYMRFDMPNGRSWQMHSAGASGQNAKFYIRDETWGHDVLVLVPSSSQFSAAAVFVYTPGYFESAAGFNAAGTGYDAFRSASGGVVVQSLRARLYTHIGSWYGVPTAAGGDTLFPSNGCMYHDDQTGTIKVRVNGAWRTMSTF